MCMSVGRGIWDAGLQEQRFAHHCIAASTFWMAGNQISHYIMARLLDLEECTDFFSNRKNVCVRVCVCVLGAYVDQRESYLNINTY